MSKVQIVWFRDLELWSVALQNQTTLKSHFPLTELKEVLNDLTEQRKFTILDNEFYQEPTISSKTNEISARKSGLGSEFKVKKRVRILKGDLVIAKMHTQNGLYAFANEDFASTTTFIPFEIIESKINKNYLFIILKQTLARLQKFDSVNRETYKTDEILALQIPLPPLEIQKEIVAKVESIKAKIKALQEEEKRLKNEIETYIYIALGLQKPKVLAKQKVFIVRFKDLTRWDTRHNQSFALSLPQESETSQTCPSSLRESKTTKAIHTLDYHEFDKSNSHNDDILSLQDKALSLRGEAKAFHSNPTLQNGLPRSLMTSRNDDLNVLLSSIPTPPRWEMVTLGELLSYERPDTYIVSSEKYNNEYKIPVLTAGKTFILGYTDEKENIYKNVPVIIFDDFTTATQFVDFEFKVKSSAMKILKNRNDKLSNIKFIFYAMQTIKLNLSLALRRYWISMYKDIKIPLPPLAVQEQIVTQVEALQSEIKGIDNELHALEQKRLALLQHYLSATNERERES